MSSSKEEITNLYELRRELTQLLRDIESRIAKRKLIQERGKSMKRADLAIKKSKRNNSSDEIDSKASQVADMAAESQVSIGSTQLHANFSAKSMLQPNAIERKISGLSRTFEAKIILKDKSLTKLEKKCEYVLLHGKKVLGKRNKGEKGVKTEMDTGVYQSVQNPKRQVYAILMFGNPDINDEVKNSFLESVLGSDASKLINHNCEDRFIVKLTEEEMLKVAGKAPLFHVPDDYPIKNIMEW